MSREPTKGGQQYKVGLIISLVSEIPTKKKLKPSEFAQAYAKEVAGRHDILKTSEGPQGPFFAVRIDHRDGKGAAALRQFTLIIANDRTGSAFLLVAEAPEGEWDASWPKMEAVIKRLLIDDER